MTKIPTSVDLLKAGAHYGHKKGKWNPKMAPFIFDQKKGIHIIDVEKTAKALGEALEFVETLVAGGGTIVFVGTKKQAQEILKKNAIECGMPYVTERWLGGMLTNFSVIYQVIKKYKSLKERFEKGEMKRYTKKEQSKFAREMAKHEKLVGGLATLTKLPDAIFVVDVRREDTAVREANRKNVPVVAMCDTNADPDLITRPIPINDDATRSIEIVASLVCQAAAKGKAKAATATPKPEDPSAGSPRVELGVETGPSGKPEEKKTKEEKKTVKK